MTRAAAVDVSIAAEPRRVALGARRLRIGIDFDNTLIAYDHVFRAQACARKLLSGGFRGSKQAVRDAVRLLPDGEVAWQHLQGYVYGQGIGEAALFAGVDRFLRRCRQAGHTVFIVSHKTEYANYDPARVNLRAAALGFMEARGFFDPGKYGIPRENVFFEGTRADKLARIAALGCSHFVDDLVEVLTDPDFPAGVERVLFGAADGARTDGLRVCTSWREIAAALLTEATAMPATPGEAAAARDGTYDAAHDEGVLALARDLVGGPVEAIAPLRGGRNARVFRVAAGAEVFALKLFPPPADGRDRLASEIEALRLMQDGGIAGVARLVAADPARRGALLTWLDGVAVTTPCDADIDAAAEFLAALHAMGATAAGRAFRRPAAEACLSGREVERQIRARLAALMVRGETEPALAGFLRGAFAPALATLLARAERAFAAAGLDFAIPLPQEKQSLVPADFGFHNCLRSADGRLRFLDFEYFGWDDPVKLTADMLHHPGSRLGHAQAARLRAAALHIYGNDPAFATRLVALYPLFGLRWALILLNEFLPERWRRRVEAGETQTWPRAKARQLARADDLVARLAPRTEAAYG